MQQPEVTTNKISFKTKKGKPDAGIIWLHGLGATGEDFLGLVDELTVGQNRNVRFVFPNAQSQKITVNNGMIMPAWYDIYSLDLDAKDDVKGIEYSAKIIANHVQDLLLEGIKPEKIIVGGFSQGGAMALYHGLTTEHKLGGIICLSAYLLRVNDFLKWRNNHNDIPIFMAHGVFDPVVPFHLGQKTFNILENNKYNVDFKQYPLQHTVSKEEVSDINSFIEGILKE